MTSPFSSKYFKILKTLDDAEFKSYGLWLSSPWFNTNKNLIRLFEKIKKYYPLFENEKLTKEKLSKQVFPKGKFSEKRINNLLSDGYLAVEQFIIFHNLNQNQNLQKNLLSEEFQTRGLEDWFFRFTKKEIERLEAKAPKDWEEHLEILQLNRRIYHHPYDDSRMQLGGKAIIKINKQIDLVYLLESAAIINEKIFRTQLLKNENHDVEAELKKWKQASIGFEHPSIELYKIRFDENHNVEAELKQYYDLRMLFLDVYKKLNIKEQKIHLISLLNDSTKFYKQSLLPLKDVLPLYKIGLKTEILLHQGEITYRTYSTIVSASNISKDFEFTRDFINSYTKKLSQSVQKDANAWAHAHTFYNEKKLNECLDILIIHDFKIHYYQLISKLLTTQVYFDLHLSEDSYNSFLFNYFDSFEKWILREKFLSASLKKSYLRFIQISRTLAKHFVGVNFQPEAVIGILEKESNVQAVGWIEEKIGEILKIKKVARKPSDL